MKKQEVPQDGGLLERWNEICYAVDDSGRYTLVPSAGWEAANVANQQAWEAIREELAAVWNAVKIGEQSPLAFHMLRHLMSTRLLAQYARMSHWRVKRHMNPKVFQRLPLRILQRYAEVFELTVDQVRTVPSDPFV